MVFFASVSELTTQIKNVLGSSFPSISLEGEISNFKAAASGHWYFTMKDDFATIQAVMFRGRSRFTKVRPADGMLVKVTGAVTVYEQRGNYQIICESMEEAGTGRILLRLEELKQRFLAEGLFDPARKRPLPLFPATIGVVTSPTGSVIRDVLTVLKRRGSTARVLVFPSLVQGTGAAEELARRLRQADESGLCDVIILCRGGGSLEDLLPFSEETVVRAVANSRTPVVSAVGHETDTSLSDFAADLRAPTPSAAAELVSAAAAELLHKITTLRRQLVMTLTGSVQRVRTAVQPFRADTIEREFRYFTQQLYQRADDALDVIVRSYKQRIADARLKLTGIGAKLEYSNPLRILELGYAAVTRVDEGSVVTGAGQVPHGGLVELRFADGTDKAKIIRNENGDLT